MSPGVTMNANDHDYRTGASRLSELMAARAFSGPPPPVHLPAAWARLAARLCRSPNGFIATLRDGHWVVAADQPLTPSQYATVRRISGHVIEHRQPATFSVGTVWSPHRNPAALVQIAVPIGPSNPGPDAVLGVLDITTRNHDRNLQALIAVAEAYAELSPHGDA